MRSPGDPHAARTAKTVGDQRLPILILSGDQGGHEHVIGQYAQLRRPTVGGRSTLDTYPGCTIASRREGVGGWVCL